MPAKQKTPKTFETAGVGETYVSGDGKTYRKVRSPYDPTGRAVLPVLVEPGSAQAPVEARPAPSRKPRATPAPAPPEPDHAGDFLRHMLQQDGAPSYLPMGADMSEAYERRADERETAQLQEQLAQADHEDAVTVSTAGALSKVADAAGNVASDIGKGLFLEGGQAVLSGVKKAANETLDLIETAADALPGGAVVWGDTDNNPATANGIRLEVGTGKAMKAKTGLTNLLPRFGVSPSEQPTTVTGKLVEGASQFAAGMAGAGKVLKGWAVASKAGTVAKALAQGALSDFTVFDAHQARISDLLAKVAPDKAKPIFDYLASDATDGEIEGRLKNAVEGLGLGAATEGFLRGVRLLRAANTTRAEVRRAARAAGMQVDPAAEAKALEEHAKATEAQVSAALGDPAGEPVTLARKAANQKASGRSAMADAKAVDGATVDPNPFEINFARIDAPEDVQAVISTLVRRHAGDAEAARRGVRSWAETQASAERLDWVTSMAKRRTGEAVNAETAFAYREALNASAAKLLETARAVKAEPSIANQYAFRRMLATHRAIQLEFMGARAEAGRALNAFRIPAAAPQQKLRQIDAILAESGGANTAADLAGRVLDAAKRGDIPLNVMVAQGAMARSRAIVKLVYTNSLLSGLGTPVINVAGNTSAALMNVATRAVSPRIAKALGSDPVTEVGEAAAIVHGYMSAIRDMFRMNPAETLASVTEDGARALRQEGLWRGMAPGIDQAAPAGIRLGAAREEAGAVGDVLAQRPLGAAAWGVSEDSTLGRVLDVVQMLVESPSNFNATADDFFKVVAARGELHAQAFRQAMREYRDGMLPDMDAVKLRLREIVDEPTPAMLDAAEREMHELTFSRRDGRLVGALSTAKQALDSYGPIPIGTILLPFLRTPANLISLGMRYSPLAPFMARHRADLLAGGARAETAKAQLAIGTALWSVWIGMAMDGDLTGRGPGNRAQREAMMRSDEFGGSMWQPHSVRIGERWVDYSRLEPPWGTSMSLVADLGEVLKQGDWDDSRLEDATEVAGHVVSSLGQAFMDRSALSGALDLTQAFTGGDANVAERAIMGRASGAVPASGLLRTIRRGEDPYLRETHDAVTAIANTIPGLSEGLPVQRDLWGRPRTYQTGLGSVYDAVLPVQTKEAGGSIVDLEMLRHRAAASMPDRSLNIDGVRVSLKNRPDIYSEYVRRAGEPAYAKLKSVISGDDQDSAFYAGLSDGPDGDKVRYIKDVIEDARRNARAEVQELYSADLRAMAADAQRRRDKAGQGAQ